VARRDGTLLADAWLPDLVRRGELERHLGGGVIEAAVDAAVAAGRLRPRQRRRIMSYPLVIRLMIAVTLMPDASYREALARLAGLLADIPFIREWHVPAGKVVTDWRLPVPPGLLEDLFWQAAGPLTGDDEPSAVMLAGMPVGAADGMLVNLADTPANRASFGSTGTADDSAPFPQLRVVAVTARADRAMVASALRTAELAWSAAIPSRLDAAAVGRVLALVGWGEDARGEEAGDESGDPGSLLALIKSMPGNVSLESMLTEIRKLRAARGIGLPARLFADVAPKVLAGWRARCAVESPSHLRRRSPDSAATLLAALVHERLREITDDLTELLIATVHRIDARAHKKVTDELINAFKRVDGKENLLFQIAEAALAEPDGTVSRVVYPAVRGGEQTLRELVHEYKTKGPVYRRTVQTALKASYAGHYRKGMIGLLEVLEFRSTRRGHPLLAALEVIRRHARSGSLTYYPPGEAAPGHKGIDEDWAALVYRTDRHGKQRVVRMTYEVATFRALREMLRCKEIWVVGAGRYRKPGRRPAQGL
jgi:hypothetical protein